MAGSGTVALSRSTKLSRRLQAAVAGDSREAALEAENAQAAVAAASDASHAGKAASSNFEEAAGRAGECYALLAARARPLELRATHQGVILS
jgi:hypothetical protein